MWKELSAAGDIAPWTQPGESVCAGIIREALRYCPEFPFIPSPQEVFVKPLSFYDDYMLVRLAESSDKSREVYGLYAPGDFCPIDALGKAFALLTYIAPLHLDSKNVLEYALTRTRFELAQRLMPAPEASTEFQIAEIVEDPSLILQADSLAVAGINDAGRSELAAILKTPILENQENRTHDPDNDAYRVLASAIVSIAAERRVVAVLVSISAEGGIEVQLESSIQVPASLGALTTVGLAPLTIRMAAPILDWAPVPETDDGRIEIVKEFEFAEEKVFIRAAALPFYENARLFEVLTRREDDYQSTYALVHDGADKRHIYPLYPSFDPMGRQCAYRASVDDSNVNAYLRFALWAIAPSRYLPVSLREVRLLGPSDVWKRLDFTIEPVYTSDQNATPKSGEFMLRRVKVFDPGNLKEELIRVTPGGTIEVLEKKPVPSEDAEPLHLFSQPGGIWRRRPPKITHELQRGATASERAGTDPLEFLAKLGRGTVENLDVTGKVLLNIVADKLIRNCRFQGDLTVDLATDGSDLTFVQCLFERGICARNARLGGSVILIDCEVKAPDHGAIALDLEQAQITNSLLLFNSRFAGSIFAVEMRAQNVQIHGCFVANSLPESIRPFRLQELAQWNRREFKDSWPDDRWIEDRDAVCLDGAQIGGRLEICAAGDSPGRHSDARDYIATCVMADKDVIVSTLLGSISGKGIVVQGRADLFGILCSGIDFGYGRFQGDVCFYCGGLDQSDAKWPVEGRQVHIFRSDEGAGLELGRADIRGVLDLQNADIRGDVSLYAAALRDNLDLLWLRSTGKLNLVFTRIGGFMTAFRSEGCSLVNRAASLYLAGDVALSGADIRFVDVRGALIGGKVEVRNAKFGSFVFCLGAEPTIYGGFSPQHCRAKAVQIRNTLVDGKLDMSGIQLGHWRSDAAGSDTEGIEFEITKSHICGDLKLFEPDLLSSLEDRWGGSLNWLEQVKNNAADGFGARISGDLRLNANTIEGRLDLRHARANTIQVNDSSITLDVEMAGTQATQALQVRRSQIKGTLRLLKQSGPGKPKTPAGARIEGEADLSATEAGHLVISKSNFPNSKPVSLERAKLGRLEIVDGAPARIDLSQVEVDRWVFNSHDATAEDHISALRNMEPFARSTWIQVENALRNEARQSDADLVFASMRRKEKEERAERGTRFVETLTEYFHVGSFRARYSYPMYLAVLMSGFLFIMFSQPEHVRATTDLLQVLPTHDEKPPGSSAAQAGARETPRRTAAAEGDLEKSPLDLHLSWTWSDAAALTLRYEIPLFSSLTRTRWEASRHKFLAVSAEDWALAAEIEGWIAWPLFLLYLGARQLQLRGKNT